MTLRINVLGQLGVIADGHDATPSKRQARQLLTLLAAEQFGWVTVDVLQHDFWPDSDVKDPKQSLHGAVSRLREQLGKPDPRCVVQHAGAYRLDPNGCEIDLVEWADLVASAAADVANGHTKRALALYARARALWRGPALDGVEETVRLTDAKERLRQSRIQVVFREAQLLADSDPSQAAELLIELLGDAPLREDIAIAAMRALRDCGRKSDAIKVAHELRDRLADSGLVPTSEFEAAESAVHVDAPRPAVADRQPPIATLAPPESLRDAIVAFVTESVGGARAPLLYLAPPDGLAVTHVVTVAVDQLRSKGHRIIPVRAPRDGASSLRRVLGASPLSSDRGVAAEHAMAITAWEAAAANEPTVIVIDSPALLDAWSIGLLDELLEHRIPGLSILAHGDRPSVQELQWLHDAALPPLEHDAILQLVIERLGSQIDAVGADLVAGQISSETNGRRLEVEHQIDELFSLSARPHAALPETLSTATIMHSLPGLTVETLANAAALGDEVDCQLLSVALDCTVESMLEAVGPAIARGALVESRTDGRWVFGSEALHSAALDEIDFTRGKELQLAAGRWLLTLPNRRAQGAGLLRRALPLGDQDEAAAGAVLAGTELRRDGAYLEAATQFEVARSLALTPQGDSASLLAEATCRELAGEHKHSQELYETLFQAAARGNDDMMLVEAALGGAGQASRIGGLPDRCRRLGIASQRLSANHPRRDEVDAAYALELISSRRPLADQLRDQLVTIAADDASAAGLTAARVLLVSEEVQTGSSAEAAAIVARRALVQPEISDDDRAAGLATAIHVALSSGSWTDAEHWIAELQLLGENYGTPRGIWQSRAFDASLLDCRGESQRAEEVAEAARVHGRRLGLDDAALTYGLRTLAQSIHRDGLARFVPFMEHVEERYDFPIMYGLRALALVDAGELEQAKPVSRHLVDQLDDDLDFFRAGALALGALVFAHLDDPEPLMMVREALARRSNKFVFVGYGGPCLGPVSWFRGVAAAAAGDKEESAAHFEQSVSACQDVGARSLLAMLRTSSRLQGPPT